MSQTENAVTSSSGTKRTYRKGNLFRPERGKELLWLAEATLIKAFHAVIQARLKDRLSELADEEGITQAQMLEN